MCLELRVLGSDGCIKAFICDTYTSERNPKNFPYTHLILNPCEYVVQIEILWLNGFISILQSSRVLLNGIKLERV